MQYKLSVCHIDRFKIFEKISIEMDFGVADSVYNIHAVFYHPSQQAMI